MGTLGITMKIMPSSPDADLEEIEQEIGALIQEKGGKNTKYSEEPIAFGLKAIIAFFELPETANADKLEEEISQIIDVNSVQTTDMRRLL
ncbi:MAG: elongation factor 1-beta [Nanoarchaeota archaeon]|nr:elongation factor 1-beta [Nanoarchaeota archaeon]